MEMPEGWKKQKEHLDEWVEVKNNLNAFGRDAKETTYYSVQNQMLSLLKEMAEALELADKWLAPDGYCLATEKKIKETIQKFKEWK